MSPARNPYEDLLVDPNAPMPQPTQGPNPYEPSDSYKKGSMVGSIIAAALSATLGGSPLQSLGYGALGGASAYGQGQDAYRKQKEQELDYQRTKSNDEVKQAISQMGYGLDAKKHNLDVYKTMMPKEGKQEMEFNVPGPIDEFLGVYPGVSQLGFNVNQRTGREAARAELSRNPKWQADYNAWKDKERARGQLGAPNIIIPQGQMVDKDGNPVKADYRTGNMINNKGQIVTEYGPRISRQDRDSLVNMDMAIRKLEGVERLFKGKYAGLVNLPYEQAKSKLMADPEFSVMRQMLEGAAMTERKENFGATLTQYELASWDRAYIDLTNPAATVAEQFRAYKEIQKLKYNATVRGLAESGYIIPSSFPKPYDEKDFYYMKSADAAPTQQGGAQGLTPDEQKRLIYLREKQAKEKNIK